MSSHDLIGGGKTTTIGLTAISGTVIVFIQVVVRTILIVGTLGIRRRALAARTARRAVHVESKRLSDIVASHGMISSAINVGINRRTC